MRNLLFSFLHLWLEAEGDFSSHHFNICVYGRTGFVKILVMFFSPSSKINARATQDLTSHTTFVHRWRYNQLKMKFLEEI